MTRLGDLSGGLAQAVGDRDSEADTPGEYGHRAVQLKRALRGAAFATGATFALHAAAGADACARLRKTLRQIEEDIFQELGQLRSAHFSQSDEDDE